MGRTEKSQGLAPPAVRRDIRAKQARYIVNKTIPAILSSNKRARKGSESSQLIVGPQCAGIDDESNGQSNIRGGEDANYVKRRGQGRRKVRNSRGVDDGESSGECYGGERDVRNGKNKNYSLDKNFTNISPRPTSPASPELKLSIRVLITDALTAGRMLTFPSQYSNTEDTQPKSVKKQPNVCILNMASPLRPGGGVLSGATSQEEFLCARTTLLPSLNESFYRLPELGGIYTTDVLVFRSSSPLGGNKGGLAAGERWWINVISAAMLRFPELEGIEDETKRLRRKDRDMVEAKMRAVLRIAASKGTKKLVLGAWGCGAYKNPVVDVAQAWKKVLVGEDSATASKNPRTPSAPETWPGIDEVVFAIGNRRMANDFAGAFGDGIEAETGPGMDTEDEENEGDKPAEELRTKIRELESQLNQVWNQGLKARMGVILTGLQAQLTEWEGGPENSKEGSNNRQRDTTDFNRQPGAKTISEDGIESGDEYETDDEEYVIVSEG